MQPRSLKKKSNRNHKISKGGKRGSRSTSKKAHIRKTQKGRGRKSVGKKYSGKTRRKSFKNKKVLVGGSSCVGPYELCNLYQHMKYTADYNQDILGGDPRTVNPSPTVQNQLGSH